MLRKQMIDVVMEFVQGMSLCGLAEFARDECAIDLSDYVYEVVTDMDEDRLKEIAQNYGLLENV